MTMMMLPVMKWMMMMMMRVMMMMMRVMMMIVMMIVRTVPLRRCEELSDGETQAATIGQ